MPFPELEPYKERYPKFAELLARLEVYLDQIRTRPIAAVDFDHAAFDLVPVLVAKSLGIDEGLALVLLQFCEEAGLVIHRYDIYCPNFNQLIESAYSKKALPDLIACPFEAGTDHTIEDYFVDLVFQFTSRASPNHTLAISM